jgi:hypothetical protein
MQSEGFASSLCNGDLDNLSYLTSDPPQIFTPNLSESQHTLEPFDSEVLPSTFSQPPIAPNTLTRVGSDKRKPFVLYDNMAHSDWVEWWLQTDFGKKSKICWDSTHSSETWKQFSQVANITDGAPKVMCKQCSAILEHPQLKIYPSRTSCNGTSTMAKHLKSSACKRVSSQRKPDITKFLQAVVKLYPFLLLDCTNVIILIDP